MGRAVLVSLPAASARPAVIERGIEPHDAFRIRAGPIMSVREGGVSPTQQPLRVLHLIDSLRPGGAERLVLTTVKHLNREHFTSVVVALFPPLDLKDEVERVGVPVHCLGLRGSFDWRYGVLELARVLRRYRPNILHTHLRYSNFYGRLTVLFGGVPSIVTTLHSLDYTHWTSNRLRVKCRRIFDQIAGWLLNAGFIAVSQAVRDDCVRHFGFKNVDVIYNYLDSADFAPVAGEDVEAARRQFGWTAKEFVFLNVARLDWEKGQRYLLLAMPQIVKSIPEARLLLVGDGPQEESLRTTARSLGLEGVVVFAGKRRDIHLLLGMADLFLFPSVAEGFGIALIEAMAAGLPIVASRSGGILEVVEDGVDGILVPPEDAFGIAEAVVRLHADPGLRRALGDRARRTVERRFSVAVGIPQLESFYMRVKTGARQDHEYTGGRLPRRDAWSR